MNEEMVNLWLTKADHDLKTAKDENELMEDWKMAIENKSLFPIESLK